MPTVVLLHPCWDAHPSGGNKFNRRIVANAQRHQFPLQSIDVEPGRTIDLGFPPEGGGIKGPTTGSSRSLRLWDSLLMRSYAASERKGRQGRDAFLMHYLPSLDPGLNVRGRSEARHLEDRIAARVSFFIATGQGLAAVLRERYPQTPSFVCEPGVDAVFSRVRRQAPGLRDAPVQLLSVAPLVAAKGYRDLLLVLRRLEGRRWFWHIVGSREKDAEFAREFENLARKLIEPGRVIFHGSLSSAALARLMSSVDLFVSASRFESYGMALAEAVAAGIPVVATSVGEASRIAGEAEHARLVPVGDPDAFLAALTAMLDVAGKRRCESSSQIRPPRVRGWDDTFTDFAAACQAGIEDLHR